MRRTVGLAALTLGALSLASCAETHPPSDAAVAPKIEQLISDYVNAYNRRDAASLAGYFARDGVFVSVTGMPVEGRDAIEKFWAEGFMRMGGVTQEAKATEIHALGDNAWGIGQYTAKINGPPGPPEIKGHWAAIYVVEGGNWKVRLLSGGPNLQAPPPISGGPSK